MKSILIFILVVFTFFGCNTKNDSNQTNSETVSPPKLDLHQAIYMRDLDAINQHIKAGTDLNTPEPSRQSSPLITAAALGEVEATNILIDAGANINYTNLDGSNALHTAIVFGKSKVAETLIEKGIDLNTQNKEGSSALHTAAFFGKDDIVKTLIEKGVDKNLKNGAGNTALEIVNIPFESLMPIYEKVSAGLEPLGVTLNYEKIKKSRPIITELLK